MPLPKTVFRGLWTAVAVGVAALLLYLAIRGVSWREVASILRGAQIRFLCFAFVLGTLAYALRALRWKVVLSARRNIDFLTVFWASSAGYLGNNFLPARAGEVIRSAMVSANGGFSKAFVLTTALVERAADLVILLLLSATVVTISRRAPATLFPAGMLMFAIASVVVLILYAVPRTEQMWKRLLHRVPLAEPWRTRMLRLLEQVVGGMQAFHDLPRLFRFVMLTMCIWSLDAYGAVLVGQSLGMDLPVEAAFVLLAGLALGSTVPSTPGYVGVFQFVTVTVLQAYGATHSAALTYSLVLQAASYTVITSWGLIGIWRFRADRQVRREPSLVPADARDH